MSHIDTAYKLGALQAMEDFKEHLAKQAAGSPYTGILAGADKGPTKGVIPDPVGKGDVNVRNPRGPGNAPAPAPPKRSVFPT